MTEAEIKELQAQNYKYRVEKENADREIERLSAQLESRLSECERLEAENSDLERRIEAMHERIAGNEHEKRISESGEIKRLRDQVCDYGQKLEKTQTELKHVKRLLFDRNRRYQEDCITINQLTVTVDVLAGRLARNMGV